MFCVRYCVDKRRA